MSKLPISKFQQNKKRKSPVSKSFSDNNSFNSTGPQNFYPSSGTPITVLKLKFLAYITASTYFVSFSNLNLQ
jgi:hypothetical protein